MEVDDTAEVKYLVLPSKLRQPPVNPVQEHTDSPTDHEELTKESMKLTNKKLETEAVEVQDSDKAQSADFEISLSELELSVLRDRERETWGSHPIPLENYRQYILDEVKQLKDIRRKEIVALFGQLGIKPSTANELLANLVSGKITPDDILLNADVFDCGNAFYDIKQEIWRKCLGLRAADLCCLIIIAEKREASCTAETEKAELFETSRRLEEMNCFIRCLLENTDGSLEHDYYDKNVRNTDEVVDALKTFFGTGEKGIGGTSNVTASGAYTAIVLFIGHGCENGLILPDGSALPLDYITRTTRQLWSAAERQTYNLPVVCEVIFSQCHGHCYDQSVQCERFRVRHLTDKNYFSTSSVKNADGHYENFDLRDQVCLMIAPKHLEERGIRLASQQQEAEAKEIGSLHSSIDETETTPPIATKSGEEQKLMDSGFGEHAIKKE